MCIRDRKESMGEWNGRWDESHSAFGSLVPLKRICYPHLLQHRALRCAITRRASVFFFDPTHHSLGHPPAPPPPRRRPHNKTHFPRDTGLQLSGTALEHADITSKISPEIANSRKPGHFGHFGHLLAKTAIFGHFSQPFPNQGLPLSCCAVSPHLRWVC